MVHADVLKHLLQINIYTEIVESHGGSMIRNVEEYADVSKIPYPVTCRDESDNDRLIRVTVSARPLIELR